MGEMVHINYYLEASQPEPPRGAQRGSGALGDRREDRLEV